MRWVHAFYIKTRDITTMEAPPQASWVVRKVFSAMKTFLNLPNGLCLLQSSTFAIRKIYCALRGDAMKVCWKKMICNNSAPPKCIFITQLAILSRLATCDQLLEVGVVCDQQCILCKRHDETLSHLLFECYFSAAVWTYVLNWIGITRAPAS